MSFFAKLGEKLPNMFQMGKKGLDYLVGLGEKASQIAHSPMAQGILGVLPDTIAKPVQVGIGLFDKVLEAGKTLSHDINSGEAMVKRVAGAVELSKKMDLPKMAQNATQMAQRLAPVGMGKSGFKQSSTPTLMSGVSSLRIPDTMPMPSGTGTPMYASMF